MRIDITPEPLSAKPKGERPSSEKQEAEVMRLQQILNKMKKQEQKIYSIEKAIVKLEKDLKEVKKKWFHKKEQKELEGKIDAKKAQLEKAKDAAIITHMLRDIIPISNIFVKSLHSDQNIKQIQITDFQVGMDGICKLLYYNKGIKIKEYLLNISKMNYSNYSSVISLELNDISLVDEGYIAYSAAGHGFGNEYPRVYFSSGEKIIIKRKENL